MTKLQHAFLHSKIMRRMFRETLPDYGLPYRGYKMMWRGVIADVIGKESEADTKCFLFRIYQCSDITEAERREIRHILSLSATALTERQRRRLDRLI